ncbi:FAD-dependent monooxygenase [Planosporangium mesophilum]|uniref:FAD-dependent oxidoreductase n=1 Tax=Planosporangium mesophilum TaxID=689768 RepID=A0A8J3TDF2_9ACTN|nr:FAD-dependent monooxygenase [Planosporangium mesophilum]NJC83859.1 NAD(P)-binding protein [Planosporangium mesophilum]GII22784.1 FAD-dependent oxidoreductase [Planosporangium mesophilum]
MTAVRNVLVIGAGAAGTATAILLAEAGVAVTLVEINPSVSALGSGITLQANALRVLRRLGILDDCLVEGADSARVRLRAPDADATVLAVIPEKLPEGVNLPPAIGMYRPTLANRLVERGREVGVTFRFGTTADTFEQDADGVDVTFSDGSHGRYDLVVAADGVRSATRARLGVPATIEPLGMGIWRVFAPRPASVETGELYYGGACYIAGYTPTSTDTLYAFLVEDAQDRSGLTAAEKVDAVRTLAAHYHGPWDEIRESIVDGDGIHYTQFEKHLLDGRWNHGRVVFIGDAAHTCPPTLAQGAAMAFEDALVLAELLVAADRVDDELWDRFHERRLDRVRVVVDGSVQLAQWQLDGVRGDLPGLMGLVAAVTGRPA